MNYSNNLKSFRSYGIKIKCTSKTKFVITTLLTRSISKIIIIVRAMKWTFEKLFPSDRKCHIYILISTLRRKWRYLMTS
jgi:hypothetical protein